jgi:hypothetical protein
VNSPQDAEKVSARLSVATAIVETMEGDHDDDCAFCAGGEAGHFGDAADINPFPPTGSIRAVVAALPEQTSGSDLREIVRRAVLATDDVGCFSTAVLLAEVGSGTAREGMYL